MEVDHIEEGEGSGPEDVGRDEEIDPLRDYRIRWYSCDRERIDGVLRGDRDQVELIAKLGLSETFRIRWPKAARKGVLEFVRGFDMGTKTSQFRGRSLVLTKEGLRNAFKLPQGEFSPYKRKWYGVKGMFSSNRVDGNPHTLKSLVAPYDKWKGVIRLVQELLLAKPRPSAVNGKEMWYFFAHLMRGVQRRRLKKSLKPKLMPDWADLVYDDLCIEINNFQKHLSQVGKPGIQSYSARCGTAVTHLLMQWGFSLVSLNGDIDSTGDKVGNGAGRTLIAGEWSRDTDQREDRNQGELTALVPFDGEGSKDMEETEEQEQGEVTASVPFHGEGSKDMEQTEEQTQGEVMPFVAFEGPQHPEQVEDSSAEDFNELAEDWLKAFQWVAALDEKNEELKEALLRGKSNADEAVQLLRHQIRLLKESNAALDSKNKGLIEQAEDRAGEVSRLLQLNATLEQTSAALEKGTAALAQQIRLLNDSNATLASNNGKLILELEEAKEASRAVENALEAAKAEVVAVNCLRSMEQLYATDMQTKNDKAARVQSLAESLEEMTEEVKNQTQKIEDLDEELQTLVAKLKMVGQSHAAQQHQYKGREEHIQILQESLKQERENRKERERQIQELDGETQRLEAEIRKEGELLAAEEEKYNERHEQVRRLEQSLKEDRMKKEVQGQRIQELDGETQRLEAEIRKEGELLAAVEEKYNERHEQVRSLEQSLKEDRMKKEEQGQRILEQDGETQRLQAEIEEEGQLLAAEEQKYKAEEEKYNELQEQVRRLKESLKEETKNGRERQRQIEELVKERSSTRKSLNEERMKAKKQEEQIEELAREKQRMLAETRGVEQANEAAQRAVKDGEEQMRYMEERMQEKRADALKVQQQTVWRKQQGSGEESECNAAAPLNVTVKTTGAKRKSLKRKKPDCDNEDEDRKIPGSFEGSLWTAAPRESRTKVDDSELSGVLNIPPHMTDRLTLLPHQAKGLHWMCSMEDGGRPICGGILADDQGLGKTVQLIGLMLLHREKGKPTLIVCPNSVLYQWEQEIKDKVAPGYLKRLVYHGKSRHVYDSQLTAFDVVITTYATFTSGNREGLSGVKWLRVILDECQAIKTKRSARARELRKLNAEYRWCVTGTPISNSPGELYSYFSFLQYEDLLSDDQQRQHRTKLNALTPAEAHREWHEHMVKTTLRRVKGTVSGLPRKIVVTKWVDFELQSDRILYKKLEGLIKARVQEDIDGASKRGSDILVLLTKLRQVCLHRNLALAKLKRRKIPEMKHDEKEELANALMDFKGGECAGCEASWKVGVTEPSHINRCRHSVCQDCVTTLEEPGESMKCNECQAEMKLSSVFRLEELVGEEECRNEEEWMGFDADGGSPKFQAVIDYLGSLPVDSTKGENENASEKAIIFSQWPSVFQYLEKELEKCKIQYSRVDGGMPLNVRRAALLRFKTDPEVNVILLSLHAANTGLNITAANHVLLLDHWWNPAAEDQAVDRAHRIGQKKDVKVVHFVVKKSIETTIIDRQSKKRLMAHQCLYGPDGPGPSGSRGAAGEVSDLLEEYFQGDGADH